jgi:hypothetical protein
VAPPLGLEPGLGNWWANEKRLCNKVYIDFNYC